MSKTHRKHGYDERRAIYRHERREQRQALPVLIDRAFAEREEDDGMYDPSSFPAETDWVTWHG